VFVFVEEGLFSQYGVNLFGKNHRDSTNLTAELPNFSAAGNAQRRLSQSIVLKEALTNNGDTTYTKGGPIYVTKASEYRLSGKYQVPDSMMHKNRSYNNFPTTLADEEDDDD